MILGNFVMLNFQLKPKLARLGGSTTPFDSTLSGVTTDCDYQTREQVICDLTQNIYINITATSQSFGHHS